MQEWERKFDELALSRGKGLWKEGKVADIKKADSNITAAVMGVPRYEISMAMKENIPFRMKCQCPKFRSGRNCEHMAAVLYAVYGDPESEKREMQAKKEAEERDRKRAERMEARRRELEQQARIQAQLEEEKRAAQEKKAAEEAAEKEKKAAEEAAEKERKKQEVAEKIARREAEKKAKKAERKKKRAEAEQALKEAAEAAERMKKEEELRRQQEEAERAKVEAERKAREEAERKAAQEEALRKKEEKVQAAISRKKSELMEEENDEEQEDEYCYFDFGEIRKSMGLSDKKRKEGHELADTGKVRLDAVTDGYLSNENGGVVIEARGIGTLNGREFDMRILLDRCEMRSSWCECPECRKRPYWERDEGCKYRAALLEVAEEYIIDQKLGDATTRDGNYLLYAFNRRHSKKVIAQTSARDESLVLEPKLQEKKGKLVLNFRVGADKLFVIKDFVEFCKHVRNSETATYGSSTQINHQLSNFTQRSQEWYGFINKVITEEEEVGRRLGEEMGYDAETKCSAIHLYGWRLDQFFQMLGNTQVQYEEKLDNKKIKHMLSCKEADPAIEMKIRPNDLGDDTFHGVAVSCEMPAFYQGMDTSYYIDGEFLCKADKTFAEAIAPLAARANAGNLAFTIGRKKLSEFYYSVLPTLGDYVNVVEEDSDEIHAYLPPEVQFVFYLDAENHNMTCKVHALYGEKEVSVLDILDQSGFTVLDFYRMKNREDEILFRVSQLFPEIDVPNDMLHCDGDEELMYQVLEHGVDELMELGEVKCTQRFRSMNLIRRVKMSVGVSVSKGMLDLDISTEDVSKEELLDILRSYRSRKKYYRLKNGSFLNMEDEGLGMLAELMETMHLSPKEFVKGKMHLPAYRTLYLDKLLEENETVYNTRDSHFREMVKNFKTINDADYEEPASLAPVMRNYQRNGYKWLRTLESYGFGGILADDMGLGKTLQTIAVLLAAKEEGKGGTSLVVSPSSLVYNWLEEFQKFAPDMKVVTITGNQEARQEKLADWKNADVLITSYDLLKRDIHLYEDMEFTYEIIDEAQYIKNHSTAAAKSVKVIKSRMRFALTGTPIENRLSELWSIFDYLMPGFLYGYDVFRKEMETPIAKNSDEDAMKRLQRMTGPFILRRLKKDVLKDLPDKLEEIRYVQMEDAQRKAYDAQVVHMQAQIGRQSGEEFNKNKLQILAELTRLRQICCDPTLCFENYHEESAKLESCLELVQSAIDGGHKILLFSQFTSMLEILQRRLENLGIAYYVITGSTSKEKRLQMVKAFNGDGTPIFLISLKAGGVGLNLTGADVVIHYDPWWNVAAQEQATDRAHRIGQTKKVTVYKMITRNTVEEKILKLQETKRDLADSIINAQTGQLAGLSKEDILMLLGV